MFHPASSSPNMTVAGGVFMDWAPTPKTEGFIPPASICKGVMLTASHPWNTSHENMLPGVALCGGQSWQLKTVPGLGIELWLAVKIWAGDAVIIWCSIRIYEVPAEWTNEL